MSAPSRRPDMNDQRGFGRRDMSGRGGGPGGFGNPGLDHRLSMPNRRPPMWVGGIPGFSANSPHFPPYQGADRQGFNRQFSHPRRGVRIGWGVRPRGDSQVVRDQDPMARRPRRPRSPRNGVGGSRSPSPATEHRFRVPSPDLDWKHSGRIGAERWGEKSHDALGPGETAAKRPRLKLDDIAVEGEEGSGSAPREELVRNLSGPQTAIASSPMLDTSCRPDYAFSGLQASPSVNELGGKWSNDKKPQVTSDSDPSDGDTEPNPRPSLMKVESKESVFTGESPRMARSSPKPAPMNEDRGSSGQSKRTELPGDDGNTAASGEETQSALRRETLKSELLRDIEDVDNLISATKRQISELKETIRSHASQQQGAEVTVKTVDSVQKAAAEEPPLEDQHAAGEPMDTKDTSKSEPSRDEKPNCVKAEQSVEEVRLKTPPPPEEVSLPSPVFGDEFNVHTEFLKNLIIDVARQNRSGAAQAERSLMHLCHEKMGTLAGQKVAGKSEDHSVIEIALKNLDHVKPRLTEHIAESMRKEHKRKRSLSWKYLSLRRQWLDRLKLRDASNDADKRRALRERDQYILMATRGTNIVSASRTGGRVAYKPGSSQGSSFGAPSSLREVEIMLNEIESAGGTAGGQDRWIKTLASIPDQEPSLAPIDAAPVLIENPLEEHLALRAVNPWTRGERLVFLEKYGTYQKNFSKIATFLDHKSVADVVRFYFQNKMRLNLKPVSKDSVSKRRVNGNHKRTVSHMLSGFPIDSVSRRAIIYNFLPDGEPRKVLKSQRIRSDYEQKMAKPWTAEEKQPFYSALRKVGLDFDAIAASVSSRSAGECESFYRQQRMRLGADAYLENSNSQAPGRRKETVTC